MSVHIGFARLLFHITSIIMQYHFPHSSYILFKSPYTKEEASTHFTYGLGTAFFIKCLRNCPILLIPH